MDDSLYHLHEVVLWQTLENMAASQYIGGVKETDCAIFVKRWKSNEVKFLGNAIPCLWHPQSCTIQPIRIPTGVAHS